MTGRSSAAAGLPLAVGLALWGGLLAAAPFLAGALAVTQHEGDALHLADLVLRMAEKGQMPHRDFMTPLGIAGLWPIAAFVQAGLGLGHAFLAAQAAVAAVLFLPILRAAQSRLPGGLAWIFGAYVLGMVLALIHGETQPLFSVSMHYNRWAWAMAYVAVVLAVLEPLGPRRPRLDGALIGVLMAGLGLVKVTYVVALAPALVVALLARRDLRTLGVAVLSGLLVLAAVTALLGPGFWGGYLRDLLTVAGSTTRAAPGDSLAAVLAAPKHVAATLVALMTVIFLRQSGRGAEGLALLWLVPAFAYVTYQNFGNDPQWLVLVGLIALALRPERRVDNGLGWPLREALLATGVAALALATGPMVNLVTSPLRHAFAETEAMVPLLSARPQDADLRVLAPRVYRAQQRLAADGPGQPFAAYATRGESAATPGRPAVLNGETLPACELLKGYDAWFETVAADLLRAGHARSRVLVADLFSSLWLFGPFEPVRGAAPWYYGGTPGIEAADHVLVPLCPTGETRRDEIVKAIAEAGWRLIEEHRTATYILLRPERP
ncbi:hypothetical protein [Rhodobacter capsulatus]|uniref:Membrane protein, putative n=1 Tax=Rhodobacter capsulatus (strain ATCC BAA-309 / NBRC 16581 / SB1003) TaxID=272942 RepID=D5ARA4_RHOCB|nr:hypothetical protein [Rhodobacter capsulatus]ADE86909.1 membrane protein, putative [Rhodobacter capsulatus SB 1003]ETD00576.1 hypothetical protein U714_17365 [Rhodobacter capsulatus DE442]ETD74917.1 hypothetical protein U717_17330 [Rhodobacter capsulatus R121]ETE52429.1 hypothetical protein U715_17320 [Rhodobacter capsulatus Y262]MDS0928709.1 hypothetical protein [Rhodobacter capsulatus]